MGILLIQAGVKNILVLGSQLPEGQLDDARRHLAHAQLQQQEFLPGLLGQPMPQERMVTRDTFLPDGPFQKGIVPHSGNQDTPAIRVSGYHLLRQIHTIQCLREPLNKAVVCPDLIVTRLAALAKPKVSLKGTYLLFGK